MIKHKHKPIFATYKILFALLGLSALITDIAIYISRGTFNPITFFSYFTIQSNVIAAVSLICSAVVIIRNVQPRWVDYLRGGATLFMALTGVVFALLLSNLDTSQFATIPWDNTVLHQIMPVVLVLDWLIDPPYQKTPLQPSSTLVTVSFSLPSMFTSPRRI
ncbi:MAG: Pr6Pr family membrane protein [Candidatus Saccharimonadales bacterium]